MLYCGPDLIIDCLPRPAMTRKIIHVDMDAFYASVEQRDRPELRGRPVIVGSPPQRRGVVAAASYQARAFGVHSAMPSARAVRLCPQAVFVAPRFDVYRSVSREINAIFNSYTWLVEPLSLDEAYLDVTGVRQLQGSATRMAQAIRQRIFRQTGLTASAGVSCNKLLAKLASDMDKPDGLVVIAPDQIAAILADMDVARLPGIGRVTAQRLRQLDIHVCSELAQYPQAELVRIFGRNGQRFSSMARGDDDRAVKPHRAVKSISAETTFISNLSGYDELAEQLAPLVKRVAGRLGEKHLAGRTVTLKLKYADFRQITRQQTLPDPVQRPARLQAVLDDLLSQALQAQTRPIRLIGAGVSNLERADKQQQAGLFAS